MTDILREVIEERKAQDIKWGEQNYSCLDEALLKRDGGCTPQRMCEEYEIPSEDRGRFLCENSFENGVGTYAHIALEEFSEVVSEFDPVKRRKELIQLTAVCVAWVEKIDRDLKRNN
tara:strand:- start:11250 stop:11600 length:351 start_codon:yes stop_codon:yes gene_type:complete